ncbi:hypothetical protein cyc_00073 [Cyclospora cayetanensis]|uniref:Derlin n=1 Tax=Cyclospora cayetanensis TaxID=88456 RepID=A0A1D3CXA5_9EIME|nr:hypothetical protein cyc_00073 [Cyclospora cayetanensis]
MDPTMGTLGGLSGAAAAGPEAWYLSQPPITRAIATATFVLTLLTNLGLLPVELLMLDWSLAIFKLQIWRLFTTLLYVGRFSLGWVFHMYMWLQVSGDLESNAVFRQASKGAYLLFVLIVTLITSLLSLLVFWPSGIIRQHMTCRVLGASSCMHFLHLHSRDSRRLSLSAFPR